MALAKELRQLEAETFEIHDVVNSELAMNTDPAEGWCSCCSSCACYCSGCSCLTHSCTNCSY
ncbi:hypothetical protein [Actinokineospora sp.]|uniref:hypothetical protein n=1 Tax=Actinokineospora sp. TaxID=1872133 RepID=UPI00403777DA